MGAAQPAGRPDRRLPELRPVRPAAKHAPWPLLVQLDTDEDLGVMWAGAGVGHLFGNPHRLAHGDTWDIAYHWDCG
ncbi:MAG: DUF1963 domain-containing protein [Streptosporangiales bacterium]|nr:DUF1963 domain-containing protein [Streptosporangiales bacterium]